MVASRPGPRGAAGAAAWAGTGGGVTTARPRAFFACRPALLRLLHAFAASGLTDAACLWLDGRTVHRVRLARGGSGGRTSPAILEVTAGPAPYGLTPRELDVLTLLAAGHGNAEIAALLGTGRATVATHVEHVLAKLDERTRTGAAAVAVDQGLLRLPSPGSPGSLGRLGVGVLDDALRTAAVPSRPPSPTAPPPTAPAVRRRLLVGTVVPVNEDDRSHGEDMHRGAALAIEEVNRRGGVGGRLLEHVTVPVDARSAPSAAEGLRRLGGMGVDAVTFGYTHDRARLTTLLDTMADLDVPVLHSLTSRQSVDTVAADPARFGSIFQVCPSDDLYGHRFVTLLRRLQDSRAWRPPSAGLLVVCSDDPSLDPLVPQWVEAVGRHGFAPEVLRPGPDAAAWVRAAQQVRTASPAAALLGSFSAATLAPFLTEFLRDPTPTLLYALWAPGGAGFLDGFGPELDGLLWSTVTGRYDDALARAFERRFVTAHGEAPGRATASIHYDAVHLLARAWSESSSARATADVTAALRGLVHRGVNGAYWFGSTGQRPLSFPDETPDASLGLAHLTFQVQHGRQEIVSPAVYATATLTRPSWVTGAEFRQDPPPR